MRPAALPSKILHPPRANTTATTHLPKLQLTNEFEWLEKVSLTQNIESDISVNWSAHHASMNGGLAFEVSIAAILPLLCEQAHSIATVRHVIEKVKETLTYLNPDDRFLPSLLISLSMQSLNRYSDNGQNSTEKTSL